MLICAIIRESSDRARCSKKIGVRHANGWKKDCPDIGIDKSDWRGDIETIYDGVYVYASFYY